MSIHTCSCVLYVQIYISVHSVLLIILNKSNLMHIQLVRSKFIPSAKKYGYLENDLFIILLKKKNFKNSNIFFQSLLLSILHFIYIYTDTNYLLTLIIYPTCRFKIQMKNATMQIENSSSNNSIILIEFDCCDGGGALVTWVDRALLNVSE